MSSNYPAGVTTASLPELESPEDASERILKAEECAETEAYYCLDEFKEWAESVDSDQFALLLSYALSPDPFNFSALRDQMLRDYRDYRAGRI